MSAKILKKMGSALLTVLLIISSSTFAAEQCGGIFDAPTSTQQLNALMTKRYPQLEVLLKDPHAYYEKMRQRFHEQKAKTPENPYSFDFSEMGIPLVHDINKYLDAKIESVKTELNDFTQKSASRGKISRLIRSRSDAKKQAELELYITYLKELKNEAEGYIANGTITYQHIVEFSYFYSRASGRFDTSSYPMKDRFFLWTDRLLEGYKPLALREEYQMYKERRFGVFQMKSKYKGYRTAEKTFQAGFTDKTDLKQLWIPTNAALGNSVLMRLMNTNVHLIGVTDVPIWADGYNRPAGDFWMHDVRHESFKYYEAQRYLEQHDLTDAQFARLKTKMDDWLVELNSATAKLTDADLKKAVTLTTFNFHHDAGFPLIPSMFLTHTNTTKRLYLMYQLSGHGNHFKSPLKNLDRADAWLKEFWRQRIDQEHEALDLVRNPQP